MTIINKVKMVLTGRVHAAGSTGSGQSTNDGRLLTRFALGLIVLYNIFMLILGVVVAGGIHYMRPTHGRFPVTPVYRLRLFGLYCAIPLINSLISLCEFIQYSRGSLHPIQGLITSLISIAGYIVAFLLWQTCIFSTRVAGFNMACAFSLVELDNFWYWTDSDTLIKNLGWFLIPVLFFYVCYFVYDVIAVHYKRTAVKEIQEKFANDKESIHSFSTVPASSITIPESPPSYRTSDGNSSCDRERLSKQSDEMRSVLNERS